MNKTKPIVHMSTVVFLPVSVILETFLKIIYLHVRFSQYRLYYSGLLAFIGYGIGGNFSSQL